MTAWVAFQEGLEDKRRFPIRQFQDFFMAVKAYVEATEGDAMIHRAVTACVSALREFLQTQGSRVPGEALFDADRLECMLFLGYDPKFEGAEPPGL